MKNLNLQDAFISALSRAYQMKDLYMLTDCWLGTNRVLYQIYKNKNSDNNPADLSAEIHVSRSRITSSLESLQKKGYIQTRSSLKDGRRVIVTITKEGAAFIEGKQQATKEYLARLIEGLGNKNVEEFTRLVNLSVDIMEGRLI